VLRSAFALGFLSLYGLVLGPPLILYSALVGSVDLMYRVGVRGAMFVVRMVGAEVRISGLENIPPGVCIFMANHTSHADAPAVVGAIPRRIAILVKDSVFRIPILGRAFLQADFVPVNRHNRESAIASVDRAVDVVKAGTSLLVYPEGTRSPDGRFLQFKKGAFVMAIKAGVPIVPIACAGAHRVIERKGWRIRPGVITVTFLDPVLASQFSMERRDALAEWVHGAIEAALPLDQRSLSAVPA
jgi:1-acyl-sn-glycerol-3-phosphate acyltransferase